MDPRKMYTGKKKNSWPFLLFETFISLNTCIYAFVTIHTLAFLKSLSHFVVLALIIIPSTRGIPFPLSLSLCKVCIK